MFKEKKSGLVFFSYKQKVTCVLIYYYYYCCCILRLLAKRYKKLLAIRLGKPLINKNLRRPSFAPFLCFSLLINNR
jgi:hypothetical protein